MGMILPTNHHGDRFLPFWLFKSRASALKMRRLDERELEFYEKHCLLLPVARTHKPPAHAVAMWQRNQCFPVDKPEDLDAPDDWRRLQGPVSDGMHPFDRERGCNPRLVTPDCTTFEPWSAGHVPVMGELGMPMQVPTVDRYYAYWQVHVVELLRQCKYYEYAPLMRHVPASSRLHDAYGIPGDTEWSRTFRGKATGYHALTLFDIAHSSVVQKARAPYEGQEMPEAARNQMRNDLRTEAERIVALLGFDEAAFSAFVVGLPQLIREYRDRERTALADDVERDIWLAQGFAHYAFQYDWEAFLAAIERHGGPYYKAAVRRLDPIEAAADGARSTLKHVVESELGIALASEDAATLPDQIVDFCIEHELFEVLTGLADYFFTEEDLRRDLFPGFTRRQLRPHALAVEQLTRGLLGTIDQPMHGKPLSELLKSLGEGSTWVCEFKRMISRGQTSDKKGDLDRRVIDLADAARDDDPDDLKIARTLVLAVSARNLVVHRQSFLEQEAVGALAPACVRAVALVWLLARRRQLRLMVGEQG